jgi:hypothetical protein
LLRGKLGPSSSLAPGFESSIAAIVAVVEIAERLNLDKSAALRRVRAATQAGHLENRETRKGRPVRLVLGEPLPERCELLPPPERLRSSFDQRAEASVH